MQVKLINHCQAVRIKQQKTYKELCGLILSQGQLAKGLYGFWIQTQIRLGPLSFNLRVLAKQVSQDFMHSFLGLITLGESALSSTGLHHPLSLFQA